MRCDLEEDRLSCLTKVFEHTFKHSLDKSEDDEISVFNDVRTYRDFSNAEMPEIRFCFFMFITFFITFTPLIANVPHLPLPRRARILLLLLLACTHSLRL